MPHPAIVTRQSNLQCKRLHVSCQGAPPRKTIATSIKRFKCPFTVPPCFQPKLEKRAPQHHTPSVYGHLQITFLPKCHRTPLQCIDTLQASMNMKPSLVNASGYPAHFSLTPRLHTRTHTCVSSFPTARSRARADFPAATNRMAPKKGPSHRTFYY